MTIIRIEITFMKKFLPKSVNNPHGFTLIELMVVISIIAILSVIGITVFSGAQKASRDARRKGDIDSMSSAMEANINTTTNQHCTAAAGTYCALTTVFFAGGNVPVDPTGVTAYGTLPVDGATTYVLCAALEAGTGGNSSSMAGAPAANGGFYCKKNQQ